MFRRLSAGAGAARAIALMSRRYLAEFNFEDPLQLDAQLTEIEREFSNTVARYAKDKLQPRITRMWREQNNDDEIKELYKEMGELGLFGCFIEGYGCAGANKVTYGLIARELEAVDSAYRSSYSVQSSLVMFPIHKFGSEEQRQKYLPQLASGKMIGCFGLTEPNAGSDPGGMTTRCKKVDGGYILNGEKMWITSSQIADIAIVWAKDEKNVVRGFIVEASSKGYSAPPIHGKMSLCAGPTGGISLQDCFVPDSQLMPGKTGMGAPYACLNSARFGIAWGAIGAGEACFKIAREYTMNRKQFKRPLAANQLVQKKLADMSTELTLGLHACYRAAVLEDQGKLPHECVSMLKRNSTGKALEIARTARDMLGANGIVDEYCVMRHMCNLESVYTYEGTYDIHGLILARGITGLAAF